MRSIRFYSLVAALVLWGTPALAQAVFQTQYVTAQSAGDCATTGTCATFPLSIEANTVAFDVSGTFSGTLTFEGTVNGVRWNTLEVKRVADGTSTTTTTAVGAFYVGNAGFTGVRVRGTTWSSGQARVDATSGSVAPSGDADAINGLTSGATGGLPAAVTTCDSQAFLDMTTATTTEIVALTASQKVYVCYWLAESNGTTVMTLKRGTGTNCATGTASISPAWDLTAQVGFSGGSGLGAIFDNQTAGNALCVTSSAAVNLHVYVRYAKY